MNKSKCVVCLPKVYNIEVEGMEDGQAITLRGNAHFTTSYRVGAKGGVDNIRTECVLTVGGLRKTVAFSDINSLVTRLTRMGGQQMIAPVTQAFQKYADQILNQSMSKRVFEYYNFEKLDPKTQQSIMNTKGT